MEDSLDIYIFRYIICYLNPLNILPLLLSKN